MHTGPRMYKAILLGAFASISIAYAHTASAQTYPSKPVRMIVPWTPGGTSDVAARIVAQKLTVSWATQVFVENRAGAGGTIGTAFAAKMPPDGYSLLMGSSTELVVSPHVYKNVAYNTLNDFVPIAYVAAQPLVLAVTPQLPVNSVQELVALAKARPGSLNCSSSGKGSTLHLAQLLFESAAQVKFFHIPYSGSPQAAASTVTGETQVHFGSLTVVLELVRNGNLRGPAVTGLQRSFALPDLPTVAEAGVPEFEIVIWNALLGPRDVSPDIVNKLNGEMDRLLETADIRDAFSRLSMNISPMNRQQLSSMIAKEWTRMENVIAASGATFD
jgi:tripartite-type tricarboxylate transporter receptor subunit TctC